MSSAEHWTALPAGAVPGEGGWAVEVAAVSVVSPTVARLLLDGAGVKAGDVVVQNNAGSTVGQAVIQYAAARGARTVNILRKANEWAAVSNHLQGLGAGIVADEGFARTPAFRKLLADLPAPRVGFNSVGGAAAATVARALGAGATLVTYGASSGGGVHLPTSAFTSRGLTATGFSLDAKLRAATKAERDALALAAVADVRAGAVKQLVAREPFADFVAALRRSYARGERKVVLVMPGAAK